MRSWKFVRLALNPSVLALARLFALTSSEVLRALRAVEAEWRATMAIGRLRRSSARTSATSTATSTSREGSDAAERVDRLAREVVVELHHLDVALRGLRRGHELVHRGDGIHRA